MRDRIGMQGNGYTDCFLLERSTPNKNHGGVIRALATMKRRDIHYVIAGRGELMERIQAV